MSGVFSHAGIDRRGLDGGAGVTQPRVYSGDQVIGVHAPDISAENCGTQAKSQIAALRKRSNYAQALTMAYDADKMRYAIRKVMRDKRLKMSIWAKKAGVGERTIAEFLNGNTASPRVETIIRLAVAADVDPCDLLGIAAPAVAEPIAPRAFRTMMALLERVEREQALSAEALQSIRDLAQMFAREESRE